MQNNDYESGSHLKNDDLKNDDLYNIFGEYKFDILTFFHLLFMINIYMVARRNNIKQYLIFIFILIFNAYSLNLVITINYKNTNFQFFNDISKISLLLFGLYIYINKDNIYE
jgi:4-hydroxybenzoate polyprenyltransferase